MRQFKAKSHLISHAKAYCAKSGKEIFPRLGLTVPAGSFVQNNGGEFEITQSDLVWNLVDNGEDDCGVKLKPSWALCEI